MQLRVRAIFLKLSSYIGVRTSLFYLAPFDVILSVLIFETPYVFTKFGSMFVTLVSE